MNETGGFIFLAIVTGFGSIACIIASCCAVDDNSRYAPYLIALTTLVVLIFLTSGFLGFSGADF